VIRADMITDDSHSAIVEDCYAMVEELCDELAALAAKGDFSRHLGIVTKASDLLSRLDHTTPRPALALYADEGRAALAKLQHQLELSDVVSRA
jgi:hypothetical protein